MAYFEVLSQYLSRWSRENPLSEPRVEPGTSGIQIRISDHENTKLGSFYVLYLLILPIQWLNHDRVRDKKNCYLIMAYEFKWTASVVYWSEFLARDLEVLGSIPCASRFSEKQRVWNGVYSASWRKLRSYLEENVAAPVKKTEKTTVGIRCADHTTPSIRQSWHYFAKQASIARSA
jgi:hypothetical protein